MTDSTQTTDDLQNEPPEVFSLGELLKAAQTALQAGEQRVTVDAKALLALYRSEAWAHDQISRTQRDV